MMFKGGHKYNIMFYGFVCVANASFASRKGGGGGTDMKEDPRSLAGRVKNGNYPREDTNIPFKELRDYFLFSGQSNSIGFTTNGQSIGHDDTYWMRLMRLFSIAEKIGTSDTWKQNLYDTIQAVHNATDKEGIGPASVVSLLTDEVVKLQELGLLDQMNQSLSLGHCSFVDFNKTATPISRSGGSKPILWSANCGMSFGHELIFSKTLEMNGVRRGFETVKVAEGGTRLYEGWCPGEGLHWEALQKSIRSRKGTGKNWRGFVWAQGEQEALDNIGDPYYLGNLTYLIARVRGEMFAASESRTWNCPEEIPVIVSKVGFWPQGPSSRHIRKAQQAYCDSDSMAACVTMNDTSRFYHFDATSFLIGGHRIAKAYLNLTSAQMNFSCPLAVTPSNTPTELPTPLISDPGLISGPILNDGPNNMMSNPSILFFPGPTLSKSPRSSIPSMIDDPSMSSYPTENPSHRPALSTSTKSAAVVVGWFKPISYVLILVSAIQ